VIGLAREGLDLSKFLIEHGATVRVTDRKSEPDLKEAVEQLGGAVELRLGGHSIEDLDAVDVVYASPGVAPEHELLQAARHRGIRVSSLIELFFASGRSDSMPPRPRLALPRINRSKTVSAWSSMV